MVVDDFALESVRTVQAERSGPFSTHVDSQQIGLRDVGEILLRRKWMILAVLGSGVAASAITGSQLPEMYTSRAELLVVDDDPNLLATEPEPLAAPISKTKMDTQMDLLTSRAFAGRVVDELGLTEDPVFNAHLAPYASEELSSEAEPTETPLIPPVLPALQEIGRLIGLPWPQAGNSLPEPDLEEPTAELGHGDASGNPPPVPLLPHPEIQRDSAISVLLSRLSVERNGESLVLSVAATDPRPDMAARLANVTAELYANWSYEQTIDDTRNAVEFLRNHSTTLARNIAETEGEIATYSTENSLSSNPRDDLLRATMEQVTQQLNDARADLAEATARLERVEQSGDSGVSEDGAPGPSEFLTRLREQEGDLLRERAQLGRNLGANHPLVLEVEAKLRTARQALNDEKARMVALLQNEVLVGQLRVEKFDNELRAASRRLGARSLAEIRLRELERRLLTEQRLHEVASRKLGQLDPYTEIAKPAVKVVSVAAVPTVPSFPNVNFILMAGTLGSAVLAVIVAMLLETVDQRIRHSRAVSAALQAPVVAQVPILPRRFRKRAHLVDHLQEEPKGAFARACRTAYLASCRPGNRGVPGVVAITSTLPREGKTTLAVGMAVTAAHDGKKTIIVDLDLYTGALPKALEIDGDSLSVEHFLTGNVDLRECLSVAPKVPHLDVILSAPNGGGSSALTSSSIEMLIGTLRRDYDFVVIDTPPVLLVEDAVWIGSKADAVILVCAWGSTPLPALEEARNRLMFGHAPLLGGVLNRVPLKQLQGLRGRLAGSTRRWTRRYFAS